MQKVVGVRKDFDKELYYFFTNEKLKIGDKVVVFIDDFVALAEVRIILEKQEDRFNKLNSINRIATAQDLNKYNELKIRAKAFLPQIKNLSLRLGLSMKFVGAQYSLDCSKIVIIFSSEDRVDFRQFLKELAVMLKIRIELKQIGQRDEVKVCGGVGPCGEQCCCSRFLKDFEHVTVKMAKVQGLSLSPTKINGICGRLMCCLAYESKQYDEVLSQMPKINSEIKTPNGKGIVVYNDILRERVSVKRQTETDSFVVEDFSLEELDIRNNAQKRDIKEDRKDKQPERKQEENVDKSQKNKREDFRKEKKFNRKNEKQNNSADDLEKNSDYKKKKNKKFKKHWNKDKINKSN